MKRIAAVAALCATGPISRRDISESDAAPCRTDAKQNDEVVDRAAERRADQDPERAGEIPELGREHGPDQGSRRGDRGEVVSEENEAVGGDEVAAVGLGLGRRRAAADRPSRPRWR